MGRELAEPEADIAVEPELPSRSRPAAEAERASASEPVASDPEVGEHIGEYELMKLLGRGSAGSVFQVRRHPDGAILALKVLAASKVRRARIVQRFFDEVRAASSVHHPGLVEVYDFIEQEEPRRLAYAMEYVPGEILRTAIDRDRGLDLRLAIDVGIQICDALEALHGVGIIHRDLKPENILLGAVDGLGFPRVKLFDFGVVKFLPVDPTGKNAAAEGGTFVGTPRYMAPEQAAGSPVDSRADLFALGVMMFEMITGRCPHDGDSLRDVVMAKLDGAPRILKTHDDELLPHELTDVVDRCLRLKPSERPKDAREVASALRDAAGVLFAVGSVRLHGVAPASPSGDEPAPPAAWVEPDLMPAAWGGPASPLPTKASSGVGAWWIGALVVVASSLALALAAYWYEQENSAVLLIPPAEPPGAKAPVQ